MEIILDIETVENIKKKQIIFSIDLYEYQNGKFKTKKEKNKFIHQLVLNAPLKPQTSKIVSICWITSLGKEYSEYGINEKKILNNFSNWLEEYNQNIKRWVSFNGKKFDWPTITIRSMIKDISIDKNWSRLIYPFENNKHCDLFQILGSSLQWNLEAFKIKSKIEFGFNVQKLFEKQKFKQIKKYCLSDCRSTRDLYLKVKTNL